MVAAVGGEPPDMVASLVGAQLAVFGHDMPQGGVDVPGHPRRVSAHIDHGALTQPAPQQSTVLAHPVLHVDLRPLVAGERGVEPGQHARPGEFREFVAVVEVGGLVLFTEEQPVAKL